MENLTDFELRRIFKTYSPNGALERKFRDFILNDCNRINGERICDEPATNAEMNCVLRAFFKNLCEKYPHFLQIKDPEQAREIVQNALDDPQILLRDERQGDPAPSDDGGGDDDDDDDDDFHIVCIHC